MIQIIKDKQLIAEINKDWMWFSSDTISFSRKIEFSKLIDILAEIERISDCHDDNKAAYEYNGKKLSAKEYSALLKAHCEKGKEPHSNIKESNND